MKRMRRSSTDLGSYKVLPIFYPKPGTNVSHHYVLRKGDADKAFAEADRVFDHNFYIPHVRHVPIERTAAPRSTCRMAA
ncbi:MAG: molybdopterin cofactor-binding domain-containing protein [Eubacteriales bacterium]